jgi:hypothetical protein
MNNEAYKKLEKAVLDIDPTAKELANLIVDAVDRNYLEQSVVHFYDAIIDNLSLRVAQIKWKNLKNN